MVATAGGATFALATLAAACCVLVWLAVFLVTRYASLASIVTAVALAVFVRSLLPVADHGLRSRRRRRGDRDAPPEHAPALAGTEHRFELRRRPEPAVS